eukprot:2526755-Amphidinium_carterae.2
MMMVMFCLLVMAGRAEALCAALPEVRLESLHPYRTSAGSPIGVQYTAVASVELVPNLMEDHLLDPDTVCTQAIACRGLQVSSQATRVEI